MFDLPTRPMLIWFVLAYVLVLGIELAWLARSLRPRQGTGSDG